jgi:hypothetical protein
LPGLANTAQSTGFLFPALPAIAGHCVRVRVKLGSRVCGLHVAGCFALDRRVGIGTAYPPPVSLSLCRPTLIGDSTAARPIVFVAEPLTRSPHRGVQCVTAKAAAKPHKVPSTALRRTLPVHHDTPRLTKKDTTTRTATERVEKLSSCQRFPVVLWCSSRRTDHLPLGRRNFGISSVGTRTAHAHEACQPACLWEGLEHQDQKDR